MNSTKVLVNSTSLRETQIFLSKLSSDITLLSEMKTPYRDIVAMTKTIRLASPEDRANLYTIFLEFDTKYAKDIARNTWYDYVVSEFRFTFKYGAQLNIHQLHNQNIKKNFYHQAQRKFTDKTIKDIYTIPELNNMLLNFIAEFIDSLLEHPENVDADILEKEKQDILLKYKTYIKQNKINDEGYRRGILVLQDKLHESICVASQVVKLNGVEFSYVSTTQGDNNNLSNNHFTQQDTAVDSRATMRSKFESANIFREAHYANKQYIKNHLEIQAASFLKMHMAKRAANKNKITKQEMLTLIYFSSSIVRISLIYRQALILAKDVLLETTNLLKLPGNIQYLYTAKVDSIFNIARLYAFLGDVEFAQTIFNKLETIVAYEYDVIIEGFNTKIKLQRLSSAPIANEEELFQRYFRSFFVRMNLPVCKRLFSDNTLKSYDKYLFAEINNLIVGLKETLSQFFLKKPINLIGIDYNIIALTIDDAWINSMAIGEDSSAYNSFFRNVYIEEKLDFDELNHADSTIAALATVMFHLLNNFNRLGEFSHSLSDTALNLFQSKFCNVYTLILQYAKEKNFSVKFIDHIYFRLTINRDTIAVLDDDRKELKESLKTQHNNFCKVFDKHVNLYNENHSIAWHVPDITNRITFDDMPLSILQHVYINKRIVKNAKAILNKSSTSERSVNDASCMPKQCKLNVRQVKQFLEKIHCNIAVLQSIDFDFFMACLNCIKDADPDDLEILAEIFNNIKTKYSSSIESNVFYDYLFSELDFTFTHRAVILLHALQGVDPKQDFFALVQKKYTTKNVKDIDNDAELFPILNKFINQFQNGLFSYPESFDKDKINKCIDTIISKYKKYIDYKFRKKIKLSLMLLHDHLSNSVNYVNKLFAFDVDLSASVINPLVFFYDKKEYYSAQDKDKTNTIIEQVFDEYREITKIRGDNLLLACHYRDKQLLKSRIVSQYSPIRDLYDQFSSVHYFTPFRNYIVIHAAINLSRLASVYFPVTYKADGLPAYVLDKLNFPSISLTLKDANAYTMIEIGKFLVYCNKYDVALQYFKKARVIADNAVDLIDFFHQRRNSPHTINRSNSLVSLKDIDLIRKQASNFRTKLDLVLYERFFDGLTLENSAAKLKVELANIFRNLKIILDQYFSKGGIDVSVVDYPGISVTEKERAFMTLTSIEAPDFFKKYLDDIFGSKYIQFEENTENYTNNVKDDKNAFFKKIMQLLYYFETFWEFHLAFSSEYLEQMLQAKIDLIEMMLVIPKVNKYPVKFIDYVYMNLVKVKNTLDELNDEFSDLYKFWTTKHNESSQRFCQFVQGYNNNNKEKWQVPDIVNGVFYNDENWNLLNAITFPSKKKNRKQKSLQSNPEPQAQSNNELNAEPKIEPVPIPAKLPVPPKKKIVESMKVETVNADNNPSISIVLASQPKTEKTTELQQQSSMAENIEPAPSKSKKFKVKKHSNETPVNKNSLLQPSDTLPYIADLWERYDTYTLLAKEYNYPSVLSIKVISVLAETCKTISQTFAKQRQKYTTEANQWYKQAKDFYELLESSLSNNDIKELASIRSFWPNNSIALVNIPKARPFPTYKENKNDEGKRSKDFFVPKKNLRKILKLTPVEETIFRSIYELIPLEDRPGKLYLTGGYPRDRLRECPYNDADVLLHAHLSPQQVQEKLGKNATLNDDHVSYSFNNRKIDISFLAPDKDLYKDHYLLGDSQYSRFYIDCLSFDGIIDFDNGLEDLTKGKTRVINAVLTPKQVCRVLRINGKLECNLTDSAFFSVTRVVNELLKDSDETLAVKLSPKEIRTELTTILNYSRADKVIEDLIKYKLLSVFIPNIDFSDQFLQERMKTILNKYRERKLNNEVNDMSAFLALIYYKNFTIFIQKNKYKVKSPEDVLNFSNIYLTENIKRIELNAITENKVSVRERVATCWKDYYCYYNKIQNTISLISATFMESMYINTERYHAIFNEVKKSNPPVPAAQTQCAYRKTNTKNRNRW